MTKTERFLMELGGTPANIGFHRLVAVVDTMRESGGPPWNFNAVLRAVAANFGASSTTTIERSVSHEIDRLFAAGTEMPPGLAANADTGTMTAKQFCTAAVMVMGDE